MEENCFILLELKHIIRFDFFESIFFLTELQQNQTSKEKFGYLSTNSQFMAHKKEGGRNSRKSASQKSLINRLSAPSTRKTRMNSVSQGVITGIHEDRVRGSNMGYVT